MRTHRLFLFSILLNLFLLGLTLYLLAHWHEPHVAQLNAPLSTEIEKPLNPTVNEPTLSAAIPFSWSQLEAPDYPTYISNLRNIACPERTIRDIVMTDIAHQYDEKGRHVRLQGKPSNILQETLGRLGEEETALVESLFGPLTVNQESAQTFYGSSNEQNDFQIDSLADKEQVTMPLFFLTPDPKLKLSEEELAGLANLRKEFTVAIGAGNLNPADPEYLRRWQKAQPEMDERFRTWFGDEVYNHFQIRAITQAWR